MLKSARKIAAFLLIVGSCVLILKFITRSIIDVLPRSYLAKFTSLSFIGSSRVQKSIDPEIIGSHFDKFPTSNLGVQGGNFLSSCVMADIVIKLSPFGHKVVFVELSLLIEELPDGVFNYSSSMDASPSRSVFALTRSQSFSEQFMLLSTTINHQLFNSVKIGDEVREIIGHKVSSERQLIGFHPYDKNESHNTNSFLKWREINTNDTNSIDLTKYTTMISYLENLAKTNNSQIIFFLPVTYISQVERDIATELYRRLPATMKLEYSEDFLKEITKEEYLGDQNHLNKHGAETYSKLLIPVIESVVQKDHEHQ